MSIEPGEPETPDPTPEGDVPVPAAIAATEDPVQLTVALVEDERVPEGMVCMGSFRNGRLSPGRSCRPRRGRQIDEYGIFDEPVQVVLVARAAPPGLQCQLYAMVPLPDEEDDEPDEPWAASVPGSSYEASIEDSDEERRRQRRAPGGADPAGHTSCATSATGCTPRACRSRRWICCGG